MAEGGAGAGVTQGREGPHGQKGSLRRVSALGPWELPVSGERCLRALAVRTTGVGTLQATADPLDAWRCPEKT